MSINTEHAITNSFNIIKEMFNDRNISTSNLDNISSNELIQFYNQNFFFDIQINPTMKIIYYINNKIKMQNIEKIIDIKKDKYILFVSKEKLTTNNFKSFSSYKEAGIVIQFYSLKELQYNIYRHELVPKHEIIDNKEEIEEIKDKYLIKNKLQFPLILHTDPVCKYLNIKQGSLVKITRPSPTAGEYILYRYVV